MASKVQLDLDSKLSMGFHNGMVMPQCYETVEEHLHKIKAMEIRDDDIMLCSFPKSGERERAFVHISSMCRVPNYYFLSNKPGERKTPRFTIHSMNKITSTGS